MRIDIKITLIKKNGEITMHSITLVAKYRLSFETVYIDYGCHHEIVSYIILADLGEGSMYK